MSLSSPPMSTPTDVNPDLVRMDALIEEQETVMLARTKESQRMRTEAQSVLAGGVASSWQAAPPCAVWIDHGKGSRIWDVDGFEYSDFHGGFGVGLAGHAHPAIVEAVQDRVTKGTHFAQPTEDAIVVARALSGRVRTAPVALRQLRHRGHDGCLSPDAGGHRQRTRSSRSRAATTATTTRLQVSVYPSLEAAGSLEQPDTRSAPAGAFRIR